jgi:hypothetical protein
VIGLPASCECPLSANSGHLSNHGALLPSMEKSRPAMPS